MVALVENNSDSSFAPPLDSAGSSRVDQEAARGSGREGRTFGVASYFLMILFSFILIFDIDGFEKDID